MMTKNNFPIWFFKIHLKNAEYIFREYLN